MKKNIQNEDFLHLWKNVITKPRKTFTEALKKKHTLSDSAFHIVLSAIISAVIILISQGIGLFAAIPYSRFHPAIILGFFNWIFLILFFIIMQLLLWLIVSNILYLIARALGGKGNFRQQSYLFAIFVSPLSIIAYILSLFGIIGSLLILLVLIYDLYLLTLSLKLSHRYSISKAILTWLAGLIILVILALIIISLVEPLQIKLVLPKG